MIFSKKYLFFIDENKKNTKLCDFDVYIQRKASVTQQGTANIPE